MVQTVGLADWIGLPNPHSCHYCGTNRGVNPADKIPYRGVNPADKIPHRVVIVVPIPPRVVIVVPTRGSALSSSHYRGSTSSSSHCRGANRGFSRLDWSAQPTVQTGGSPRRGDPLFRDRQLVQEPIGCHSVTLLCRL